MTPCEKRGWKVGDRFEALINNFDTQKGHILMLSDDDGTGIPWFDNLSIGKRRICLRVEWVRPERNQADKSPFHKLTKAAKSAKKLDKELAKLSAQLPEGFEIVRTQAEASEPTEDMSDWRNWRAGDLVTPARDCSGGWWRLGKTYRVEVYEGSVGVIDGDGDFRLCPVTATLKFHSRPVQP